MPRLRSLPQTKRSGRLEPLHFRLELEAQLRAFILGQPECHLRKMVR